MPVHDTHYVMDGCHTFRNVYVHNDAKEWWHPSYSIRLHPSGVLLSLFWLDVAMICFLLWFVGTPPALCVSSEASWTGRIGFNNVSKLNPGVVDP